RLAVVEWRQSGDALDGICHLQRGQRIELSNAEGLSGEEWLEEHSAKTVVRKALPVHLLVAEIFIPYRLAAGPQGVTVFPLLACLEIRTSQKSLQALAIVTEGKARGQIGRRFDVVGLEPVIGVDIIGVFVNDRSNDVYGCYPVGAGDLADFCSQLAV